MFNIIVSSTNSKDIDLSLVNDVDVSKQLKHENAGHFDLILNYMAEDSFFLDV